MERYRTSGGFIDGTPSSLDQIHKDCAQTSWTRVWNGSGPKVGTFQTFKDVVTPRFETRMAKGDVIMSPMAKRTYLLQQYPGKGWHLKRTGTPYSCSTTSLNEEVKQDDNSFTDFIGLVPNSVDPRNFGLPSPFRSISDDDANRLISETCTNCWADRQLADSNLFESVAEYRQTMTLFGDTFVRGSQTLKKILKNIPVGAAGMYLMFVYGVLPLVKDVQSIINGLDKPVGTVRKTTRKTGKLSRSKSTNFTFASPIYTVSWDRVDNDEITVRCMSLDEYDATFAANIGFTSTGLLVTPWELIPWSFVLDWFVNVGKYLQALAPATGRKQLGSCYVVRRTLSSYYQPTHTGGVGQWIVERPVSGGYITQMETVDRLPALAPPMLLLKTDSFQKVVESRKALDALALVAQLVGRYGKSIDSKLVDPVLRFALDKTGLSGPDKRVKGR